MTHIIIYYRCRSFKKISALEKSSQVKLSRSPLSLISSLHPPICLSSLSPHPTHPCLLPLSPSLSSLPCLLYLSIYLSLSPSHPPGGGDLPFTRFGGRGGSVLLGGGGALPRQIRKEGRQRRPPLSSFLCCRCFCVIIFS